MIVEGLGGKHAMPAGIIAVVGVVRLVLLSLFHRDGGQEWFEFYI